MELGVIAAVVAAVATIRGVRIAKRQADMMETQLARPEPRVQAELVLSSLKIQIINVDEHHIIYVRKLVLRSRTLKAIGIPYWGEGLKETDFERPYELRAGTSQLFTIIAKKRRLPFLYLGANKVIISYSWSDKSNEIRRVEAFYL